MVHNLLHSGYPKYFRPFLEPRHGVYNTLRRQQDYVVIEVPQFVQSMHKSTKQFDVILATSPFSFMKKLKFYVFKKYSHPKLHF